VLWIANELLIIDIADCLDRESAGFLSTLVPTHAVGNNGEPAFAEKLLLRFGLPIEIGIFIIGAQQSDVAETCGLDSWLWIRRINRHKLSNASGLARIAQLDPATERVMVSRFESAHYKG
jgi:hypothetical protein